MLLLVCIIIAFALGIAIGIISSIMVLNKNIGGALRITNYDQDGPYMFLELSSTDMEELKRGRKYITLKVDMQSYNSQK